MSDWFRNRDEPDPPAWFMPRAPQWIRVISWIVRNPFHNLTWYYLGWVGESFKSESVIGEPDFDPAFVKDGHWLLMRRRRSDGKKRLYISYRYEWLQGYAGWRENGALGFRPVTPAWPMWVAIAALAAIWGWNRYV